MLSAGEIARGMQGALAFLQRDPAAPSYFENTAESCLRSFLVMILVAPLYAIVLTILYSNVTTTAEGWEIVGVEALRYVVDWLLFPVIFFEIARRQNWVGLYPRYISALNWVNLPLMVVAVVAVVPAIVARAGAAMVVAVAPFGAVAAVAAVVATAAAVVGSGQCRGRQGQRQRGAEKGSTGHGVHPTV